MMPLTPLTLRQLSRLPRSANALRRASCPRSSISRWRAGLGVAYTALVTVAGAVHAQGGTYVQSVEARRGTPNVQMSADLSGLALRVGTGRDSADAPITPLDIWKVCRLPDSEKDSLRRFCHELRVPTRFRRITELELSRWKGGIPDASVITDAIQRSDALRREAVYFVGDQLERVKFDSASFLLKGDDQLRLSALARELIYDRTARIRVTGLASALGSAASNDSLASKRAAVVRNFLLDRGVMAEQVDSTSEGSARSRTTSTNPADNREFDRRADILRLPPSSVAPGSAMPRTSTSRAGVSPEALLNGLTDYLIREAIRSVEEAAMKASLVRLCDDRRATKRFVTATCIAFSQVSSDDAYMPSASLLQGALRRDLTRLPVTLSATTHSHGGAYSARPCSLVSASGYFAALTEGRSPGEALRDAMLTSVSACAASSEPRYSRIVELLDMLDVAAEELRESRPRDQVQVGVNLPRFGGHPA